MITVKFKVFMDFMDIDKDYQLYVLRKDKNIVYIGISERDIWYRWFGSFGRMCKVNGEWRGKDATARHIIENMPKSFNWDIDLFSVTDTLDLIGMDYERNDGKIIRCEDKRIWNAREAEGFFIVGMNPLLNKKGISKGNPFLLERYLSFIEQKGSL